MLVGKHVVYVLVGNHVICCECGYEHMFIIRLVSKHICYVLVSKHVVCCVGWLHVLTHMLCDDMCLLILYKHCQADWIGTTKPH